jgi:hypothetical protein
MIEFFSHVRVNRVPLLLEMKKERKSNLCIGINLEIITRKKKINSLFFLLYLYSFKNYILYSKIYNFIIFYISILLKK